MDLIPNERCPWPGCEGDVYLTSVSGADAGGDDGDPVDRTLRAFKPHWYLFCGECGITGPMRIDVGVATQDWKRLCVAGTKGAKLAKVGSEYKPPRISTAYYTVQEYMCENHRNMPIDSGTLYRRFVELGAHDRRYKISKRTIRNQLTKLREDGVLEHLQQKGFYAPGHT